VPVARKLKSDRVLFTATILLVCLSVVMVYSASAAVALDKFQRPYLFLIKQGMWAALGIGVLAIVMRIDYRNYREPAFIWSCLGVVVLALVAVLFSPPVNNARRWFGIAGIGVQPSELAKLAAIFFIAALLERRMHRINEIKYALAPIGLLVFALFTLIILEPDFGTSMSLVLIATAMVFAAGLNYSYILGAALCALPPVAYLVMSSAYRRQRVMTFLDPWRDPLGAGFQVIQSIIAVGTGGVWGKGLMNGVQKLFFLPEPHTDFIYSVISEELGLIGATAVLLCFAVITWRGLRVTLSAADRFGALLALGLTTMVAVQALFNISVALGLLPTKGIPLPFVSFGGSSLLINLLGMGILLNVSQHTTA
jgi:cell division protein FtsW